MCQTCCTSATGGSICRKKVVLWKTLKPVCFERLSINERCFFSSLFSEKCSISCWPLRLSADSQFYASFPSLVPASSWTTLRNFGALLWDMTALLTTWLASTANVLVMLTSPPLPSPHCHSIPPTTLGLLCFVKTAMYYVRVRWGCWQCLLCWGKTVPNISSMTNPSRKEKKKRKKTNDRGNVVEIKMAFLFPEQSCISFVHYACSR